MIYSKENKMSLGKRFGLVAAMEEIEAEAAAAAVAPASDVLPTDIDPASIPAEAPVEIPLVEDSAEEALGQTDVAMQDIEASDTVIEGAQADNDTLDSIADKMEATQATGGMDAPTAEIAQVAVEHLVQRLNIRHTRVIPAMESFGGESSRIKATQLAVENIREQTKSVMQALYNLLVKAYEFVKNFIKSALDANVRLKARAEQMLKALEKVQGTAAKETLDEVGFAADLAIEGKVTAKSTTDALIGTGSFIEGTSKLTHIVVESMKASKDINTLITNANSFASYKFAELESTGWEAVSDDRFGKAAEGYAFYTLKGVDLAGGKVFAVYAKTNPEAGQDSFDAAANAKVTMEDVGEKAEIKEVPVATIEEAKTMVQAVIDLCDKVTAAKSELDEIEQLQSEMAKDAKSAAGAVKDDADAGKRAKSVQRMVISISSLSTRPVILSTKLALTVSKAALEYAGKSAKAYSVEPAKEVTPAPKEAEPAAA